MGVNTSLAVSDTDVSTVLAHNGYHNFPPNEIQSFINYLTQNVGGGNRCRMPSGEAYTTPNALDDAFRSWSSQTPTVTNGIISLLNGNQHPFNFATCSSL